MALRAVVTTEKNGTRFYLTEDFLATALSVLASWGEMHTPLVEQCRPLLNSLNANYGKGSIGGIQLSLDGFGRFEQRIPITQSFKSSCGWRKFRIRHTDTALTVFALGHQITQKTKQE